MNTTPHRNSPRRRGLSLLELLAALAIMGVIAVAIVPRISGGAREASDSSCQLRKAVIEVQVSLWRREVGRWPARDLSDIGANVRYFPDGLPRCPVDGTRYEIDQSTGRVNGHHH
ncbi:prepilin-type N-terminal cleavage/methylation domain-containing protein [Stieleria maiorica]|uniref:prepilin-type N-terminal cleavage/methylation domain-containing protein n=1 Tax=Stieleria maiorica TaxID=2795974 RepID=UPI00142F304C|nr:prepilin-type N-terminal cleavage/methylation domain-containing protein [Stieleria maiorica]